MRALTPEEKSATVVIYTESMLIRGDLIVRENVRVSIWLRTQGVPNFIHLYNVHMVQLAGMPPKTYTRNEAFIPTAEVIGFHLAPPAQDPLDYDGSETNRKMDRIQALASSFEIKANMRVSSAADFSSSLDVMTTGWLSLYDAVITNPYLPQLDVKVPMLVVRPNKISISPV